MIYLDSAATTLQKPAAVSQAVAAAINHYASPGRGGYPAANRANKVLFRCREVASELFDVPNPEQVVLTVNATHGLNIAIRSLVKPGSNVLISGYEHNAVTRTLNSIPNIQVQIARSQLFDREDTIRSFEAALDGNIDVVICNHVSNVFGYIQPIEEISKLCAMHKIPIIIDASQSAGMIPISMAELDAAYIAMPGHKGLYGPQGTGLLLCKDSAQPIIFGGTGSNSMNQEMPEFLPDRLEAGTQNVCGAAGLLAGMEFLKKTGIRSIGLHEQNLKYRFVKALQKVPGVTLFSGVWQSGVISFCIHETDCETAAQQLARRGIAVRAGLHCAPLAHETAGTLKTGTIRVSFSAFNTEKQAEYAACEIAKIAG